ncbi:type I restriction-modification system subunit M N-terminal domain-containing protein [uncultured Methanobrevibacter sp.]|uniref:type I restriction-modification system subunit M N-terminal domain-containing protein n=1 Tax=uncultured Methanobrevibacter sp. TaxID=253161 RepID=UPI0025DB6FE2|nr:type I restriction-modification system subunit M N-terminal domain-containing protein [uncultured Methanobrevibacter sp.]
MDDNIIKFKSIIYQEMDESRGNWSTVDYRNLILNIILIIYLSERFKIRYLELVNEGEGFEEDESAYRIENIFYLPQEFRWDNIMDNIESGNAKEIFYRVIINIKRYSPILNEFFLPFSVFKIEEWGLKRFLYIFEEFISDNNFKNEVWIELYKSFLEDFINIHYRGIERYLSS